MLGGETALFSEVVRRHQDQVYGLARKLVGESEAEDAAQEAFLRAFRGLQGFKGGSKLSTWLYRITFNLCADRLRGRALRRTESLDESAHAEDASLEPESRAVQDEQAESVRRAVDGLPAMYRDVIVLQYYQDLSVEEIASVLAVPMKTAETRLYRARKILRETLA